jgi:membrane protease YdiL (CAAX protease family)
MLKGAYAHLSFVSKFILLLVLIVGFLLFASMFGLLSLVPFYGTDVLSRFATPDYSDLSLVNAFKVLQIINMGFGMLLPTLLFLWLTEDRMLSYCGLSSKNHFIPLFLSVILILVTQPLIGYTSQLNSSLQFPDWLSGLESWMREMEDKGKLITNAFLNSGSIVDLVINVFMIALLPSIAEELLFRGVISKMLYNRFSNIHVAVFVSAFIFSAVHFQFYGFLPRFILGIELGYLFLLAGNLWLPIVAHFVNNFLSVLIQFFYTKGSIKTDAENFGTDSGFIVTFVSMALVVFILLWINKKYKINNAETISE